MDAIAVITVEVRYFASIREALGSGERIEVPEGATIATVRNALLERSEAHRRVLERRRTLRFALDQALCHDEDTPLSDGAELAFFPPVTGG